MVSGLPDGAGVRDYAYLRTIDRAGIMWEWLRRDPAYIGWDLRASSATGGTPPVPLRWRVWLAEDPALPAPEARILWRADLDPGTLRVRAQPSGPRDPRGLPLHHLRDWLAVAIGSDGHEHAVLSNGLQHLRLDVEAGSLREGPVLLHYGHPSRRSWEAGLIAMRRLMALCAERRFPAELFPPEPHPDRWIELLRVSDALRCGASQRDLAEMLFGCERARAEWQGPSDSLRSRVRRLVHQVRGLAGGGYRKLMREDAALRYLSKRPDAKRSPACLFRIGL